MGAMGCEPHGRLWEQWEQWERNSFPLPRLWFWDETWHTKEAAKHIYKKLSQSGAIEEHQNVEIPPETLWTI